MVGIGEASSTEVLRMLEFLKEKIDLFRKLEFPNPRPRV
jgi:hypothetical protein